MTMPGVVNRFSGDLSGVNLPDSLSGMTGFAQGSFVKGPSSSAQGVIGNWSVGTSSNHYSATGVFAGQRQPPLAGLVPLTLSSDIFGYSVHFRHRHYLA